MDTKNMTYAGTGVDYDAMDPYKRAAQLAATETNTFAERFGFKVVEWSRGESVFLIETPWGYVGQVIEGLGTKNKVADAVHLALTMEGLTGRSYYDNVGICNAAMAFNDEVTLGVYPVCYGQYLAVASEKPSWFDNEKRAADLIEGTKKACIMARCVWGGGETPTLKGIIVPGASDLAGGTWGVIMRKDRLINPANIKHGDAIVIIESSGIHANGLTLARDIADKLPGGYLTKLSDGRTYGETLLDPTEIYVGLVLDCLDQGVKIHYGVNITGHGWRKLMRAIQPFGYIIDTLPSERPIFPFLQKHGPVDDREAYGNLNMGAGFALYVSEADVDTVIKVAAAQGQVAFRAGHIERSDAAHVVIKPKGLVYGSNTLAVR